MDNKDNSAADEGNGEKDDKDNSADDIDRGNGEKDNQNEIVKEIIDKNIELETAVDQMVPESEILQEEKVFTRKRSSKKKKRSIRKTQAKVNLFSR